MNDEHDTARFIAEHLTSNRENLAELIKLAYEVGDHKLHVTLAALDAVLADREQLREQLAQVTAKLATAHDEVEQLRAQNDRLFADRALIPGLGRPEPAADLEPGRRQWTYGWDTPDGQLNSGITMQEWDVRKHVTDLRKRHPDRTFHVLHRTVGPWTVASEEPTDG